MTVKEIVALCSKMADLEVDESCFSDGGAPDEKAQKLALCCNCVLEQLYCDFATALKTCRVTSRNGVIDVKPLRLNRVISLADACGNNAPYRYTQDGIAVADGEYILTYALLPQKADWNDEVSFPSPRITQRIFAYGVISEYFFQIGDFSAAEIWETRYKDALHSSRVKTSSMCLPVGRWT